MPADTIRQDLPLAYPQFMQAFGAAGPIEPCRVQMPETVAQSIERRLAQSMTERRTEESRTEQFFDPDDERR